MGSVCECITLLKLLHKILVGDCLFYFLTGIQGMELGGEHPRETKKRWAATIQRYDIVGILFNIT